MTTCTVCKLMIEFSSEKNGLVDISGSTLCLDLLPHRPDRPPTSKICFWCKKPCNGTCLNIVGPAKQMRPDDPAYWMLSKQTPVTTPTVYKAGCYICEDPEFAQMGLPLCYACPDCGGHIAADDTRCDDCGKDFEPYEGEPSG
jgi:hypothetical protein